MFSEWVKRRIIAEMSMNVYVQDYDDSENVRDLDDLANHLKRQILYPMWEKLTPEQQQAVEQGGSGQHSMIVPDGSYYSGGDTVLSFYAAGWPDPDRILQGIKYHLDEKKVKYGPFQKEKSGMFDSEVYRIPILRSPSPGDVPPQINMSNQTARVIFGDLLNFQRTDNGFFNINPRDLLVKIDNLPDYSVGIHQQDPRSSQRLGGPMVHDGGVSDEQIQRHLAALRQIAQWAIKKGYNELYVA